MKKLLSFGLAACFAAVFSAKVSAEEAAPAPDPESVGYSALIAGIATPVQLPWGFDWDTFGLDLNLFYADCNKMDGIEFSLGANTARLDMKGVQASMVFNFANRDAYGAQIAIFDMCNRSFYGLDVGAFAMNREFYGAELQLLGGMTDKSFYGLGVHGLGHAVREELWGADLAIGANFARKSNGLQFSIYNQASVMRGAQIGIVNYASECPNGFQIGLVNIIMDNKLPFLPFVNGYF